MRFSRKGLFRRSYAAIALLLSILQLPTFARTATTPRVGSSSPASAAESWQITDREETTLLPAGYQTYTTTPVDSAKTGSSNKVEGHGDKSGGWSDVLQEDTDHPIAPTQVSAALHGSPVMFIENVGQFADGARFQVRGGDRTIWLAEDGLWVTVMEKPSSPQLPSSNLIEGGAILPSPKFGRGAGGEGQTRKGVNLRLTFPGANSHPRLEPFNRLDTHVSYFFGNDPEQWHADVPVWGGVRYVDLYPGVDLEITGEGGRWTWRLVLRTPSPWQGEGWGGGRDMRLRVDGADALVLETLPSPAGGRGAGGEGFLRLTTAVGDFTLPLLTVEGVAPDDQTATPGLSPAETFCLKPGTFEVSSPFSASAAPLVSLSSQGNPSDLLYSTFLGGSSDDYGYGIAVDGAGNGYLTGWTESSNFPTTPGAFDISNNGRRDVFVVKLKAAGTGLVYATFLGGSNRDDGSAIAVDRVGNAYVTGYTRSSDFPTTAGAFDTSCGTDGNCNYDPFEESPYNDDAFVVKLNAAGSALVYATFLGGSGVDCDLGIAVDGASSAYVTGYTVSSDFPTTPGGFDTTHNGDSDAFVAKLNAAGTGLAYATFLGGSRYEEGHAIAVDGAGSAYVTGVTWSSDFPTTPGSFDTTLDGSYDAFIVKLNAGGTDLAYATFLGGSGREGLRGGIAVDGAGNAYVTGVTYSSDFPTTPGAFDTTLDGSYDAFIVKLNVGGTGLSYATFLGGSSGDNGRAIAVDGAGSAYVAGMTLSSDFPTTTGAFDTSFNGSWDAFVAKVNAGGTGLVYATFLGGSYNDGGFAIAVDGAGNAYVTGSTGSPNFPSTPGAFDTSHNGSYDGFVLADPVGKTTLELAVDAPSALEVEEGRYVPNPFPVTATVTNTGNLVATNTMVNITLPISLTLEGGQSPTQPIGDLEPDQSRAVTWSVTAITQTRDITMTYTVEAWAENADVVTETKEIFIPGIASLDIVPLEQACLLRYTNVKGQWQAAATRTAPEWLSVITSTVPVTVTAVVTNTGVITAEAAVITITLPSDLDLVTSPYPAATVPLGDIAAGQAVSTTWCITKTSPIAPSGSYSWPVTLTVGAANAALTTKTDDIKVEKVYDSGYEVSRNAYRPKNDSADPNEMGPIDWSNFPRRWDVFRQVYQHEPLPPWWLAPITPTPPFPLIYFLTVHKAIFGAYCTGMSVSNGDRLSGCDDLPGGSGCPNLYALSADDIRDEVEMYQGRFLTREVMHNTIVYWGRANLVDPIVNNEAVYDAIKQTIVSNSTDRRVLDFLPKGAHPTYSIEEYWEKVEEAHAVVPYMTTETEDEKRIFVYDPNFPYTVTVPSDSIKAVRIHDIHDTEDCLGCFEYRGSYDYSDWPTRSEHGIPNALVTAPISLYREAGHSPVPGFIIAGVLSPVHLAMVDDQGRTIGVIEDGSFVADIPGSAPIFGLDHEAFALPADEDQHYLAILRGYEAGTYSYYQFQRDGLYRIQDASALPTTVDEVDVSAAGDRMSYSTNDPSKTFSAIIYRQTPNFNRVFTVANTSLAAGEVVTFEVSADLATFKYLNPGGAKTYDLGLEQAGAYSGTVSFGGLQIGANEAHIITAEDWDRLETTRITLSIDQGNDGTIEEVVVLQPGYVVFAGSQACDKTIHWSGSGNKVSGNVHSNNDIKISGSDNTITGLTEYVTAIKVSGSNNVYTPTQSNALPLPVEYDIEDYKPGGVAAEAAQQEGRYHYIGGDLKVSSSGEVLDGLYYVTGDVKLSGSGLSGEVTIVAQGRIHASGSNHSFTPYSGDLLLFSQEGHGGQEGCEELAIKVAGSGMVWDGVVYAPEGLIQVSGSNSTLKGRLIGGSLKLSGSNLEIGFFAE